VETLAQAPLDEVLHQWAGLGYYARARNLHRAAQRICAEHGGELPADLAALQDLPGIGRSTAGAILDGNVQRVLCRYYAVPGWPGQEAVKRRLWQLAELNTPVQQTGEYTQAIMDLGATLCTRGRPRCGDCPQVEECAAYRLQQQQKYPEPRPRRDLPVKQIAFAMLRDDAGRALLLRRPPQGIWGGLWSFPECATVAEVADWCLLHLGMTPQELKPWPALRHTFSHFHLEITPVEVVLSASDQSRAANRVAEDMRWTELDDQIGLAAPVQRLLRQFPGNCPARN
jgi:A/G-specific adenine glycosylase